MAVDWSPISARAVELASEIARATKARCVLVHVREAPGLSGTNVGGARSASSKDSVGEMASSWAARVRRAGVADVETVLLDGPPVDALLGYADTQSPDLLVFGRRGHSSGARMLLGGVSSSILQHARCPVLVVP